MIPNNNPDLKEFEDKIRSLEFMLGSSEVKKRMSKLLRDIIYRRVKSGKGVTSESAENPDHAKLKQLSRKYINIRERAAGTHVSVRFKKGDRRKTRKVATPKDRHSWFSKIDTGEFFAPSRSNATMTGQMLNSMRDIITLKGFKVYFPPTSRKGSKLTNAQIYQFYSKDRPFFALTPGELRILQNEFNNIVQEKIKVIFGNK